MCNAINASHLCGNISDMFWECFCHICLMLVFCSDSVIRQCFWVSGSVCLNIEVSVLYHFQMMSSLLRPEMLIISLQLYGLALCTIDFHPFLLVQTSRPPNYCVQSQSSSQLTELLLTRCRQQIMTALLLLVTVLTEIDPQNESLRETPGNPVLCPQVSLRWHNWLLLEFICICSDAALWFVAVSGEDPALLLSAMWAVCKGIWEEVMGCCTPTHPPPARDCRHLLPSSVSPCR